MIDHQNQQTPRNSSDLSALSALDWIAAILVILAGLGLMASRIFVTPAFVDMYREFTTVLPEFTKLVMSVWFTPVAGLAAIALAIVGLTGQRRLGLRRILIVGGFFLVTGLAWLYWWGLYLPLHQLAVAVSA